MKIGPSFESELKAANLLGLPFSWTPDGVNYGDIFDAETGDILVKGDLPDSERSAVEAVLEDHDPTKPAPPAVPDSVTRYQARAALNEAGLLVQVNAYFESLDVDSMDRLAWDEAPTVHRSSSALTSASGELGLSSTQVDALFIRAAQFE